MPWPTRLRGYTVANVDDPSRHAPIEELAPEAVRAGIEACRADPVGRLQFVTHSLGGILVRDYLAELPVPSLGRVVMLAHPNSGSEVVDGLAGWPGFERIHGPAGLQLGTDPDGIAARLGPVDDPVGVIAGTRTVSLVLSQLLPNPAGGKASLESTRVDGMTDFVAVPASRPFIMWNSEAIAEAIVFIETGALVHEGR